MPRVSNHFHPQWHALIPPTIHEPSSVKRAVKARPVSWQDLDSRAAAPVRVSEDTAPCSPRWSSMGIAYLAPYLFGLHKSVFLVVREL